MKKALIVFLAIVFFSGIAFAEALKIDRLWVDGDYGYALVTYTNETDSTFNRAVTIECTALDSRGNKININSILKVL